MQDKPSLFIVHGGVERLFSEGDVQVGIDRRSHEFIVGVPVEGRGIAPARLTPEELTRLGVSMIRAAGRSYDFSQELGGMSMSGTIPPERVQEQTDEPEEEPKVGVVEKHANPECSCTEDMRREGMISPTCRATH